MLCFADGSNGVKLKSKKGEWLRLTGQSAATLKGLCDRAILKVEERKISRLGGDGDAGGSSWQLNAEQQGALGRIRDFFSLKKIVFCYKGVTSSGKNGGIYSSDTGISESGTAGVVYAARDRFNRTDRKTVATGFR